MRPYYVSALWGGFVALISFVLGYMFRGGVQPKRILPEINAQDLFYYGRWVLLIGFGLFTISTGGNVAKLINPLDAEYVQQQGGSFGNYFGLALNFVIVGITLLFAYFLLTRSGLLWFIIPCLVSIGIFLTLGFRYRLVLLMGSLVIVYYNHLQKRPNLVLASVAIFLFIAFMGIVNISRQYGAGLNVSKIENKDTQDYYKSGLREALIFQTSGAVIDIVPEKHPHVGFAPVISAILFPVPSGLLPGKNSAKYLFDTLDKIYGKKVSKGSAMMAYGEYYLAFGWVGIIIGFLFLGWFSRKLWNWYLQQSNNALAVVTYAVSVTYLYVIISRGYLPQVVMLFFFTVFPVYVVIYLVRKKYITPFSFRQSPYQAPGQS
jgi:oligosaccharide repeat unit polymerase